MQISKKPMKMSQRLLAGVMAFALLFGVLAVPDMKAEAEDMIIALSAKTIHIGDKITVTVSVPAGVSASVNVNYPTSLLTYVKASSEASVNAGTVSMSIGEYGSGKRGSGTVTFEAKASGDAGIAVSAPRASASDGDQVSVGGASTIVKIENVAEEDVQSADSSLASLFVSAGELSPAFSPEVLSYTLEVDNSVTSLDISASPKDDRAMVESVDGADELAVGENTVKVKVLAENGTSSVYTVKVTRAQSQETSDDAVTEATEVEAETETENAAEGICLKSEFGYITIASDADVTTLPEGYEPGELSIPEKGTVTAYFCEDNPNICLLYAENSMGEKAWYQYDIRERTYLRWYGQSLSVGSDDNQNLKSENKILFWAFIVVVAILLVIILILLLKKGRGFADDGEDDFVDLDDPVDDLLEDETGETGNPQEEEQQLSSDEISEIGVSDLEIPEIEIPEIELPEDEVLYEETVREDAFRENLPLEKPAEEELLQQEESVEEIPVEKKSRRIGRKKKNEKQADENDEEEDGLEFIDL